MCQSASKDTCSNSTENNSFASLCSDLATDFSKSSAQKRTYSQRITILRKVSPAVSSSPAVPAVIWKSTILGVVTPAVVIMTLLKLLGWPHLHIRCKRNPKANLRMANAVKMFHRSTNSENYGNNYLSGSEHQKEPCGSVKQQAVVPVVSSFSFAWRKVMLISVGKI